MTETTATRLIRPRTLALMAAASIALAAATATAAGAVGDNDRVTEDVLDTAAETVDELSVPPHGPEASTPDTSTPDTSTPDTSTTPDESTLPEFVDNCPACGMG